MGKGRGAWHSSRRHGGKYSYQIPILALTINTMMIREYYSTWTRAVILCFIELSRGISYKQMTYHFWWKVDERKEISSSPKNNHTLELGNSRKNQTKYLSTFQSGSDRVYFFSFFFVFCQSSILSSDLHPINMKRMVKTFSRSVVGETLPKPTPVRAVKVKYNPVM